MESFDRIDHAFFMREAIVEAQKALLRGDRPIGAAVAHNGQIVARGSNTFATDRSPIAHAEMNALWACAPYLYEHGHDCVTYTTCEPCVMCLGAIVMANIRSVVFGMPREAIRAGAADHIVSLPSKPVGQATTGAPVDQEPHAPTMRIESSRSFAITA